MEESIENVMLYKKMEAEQQKFRDWLLTQPAEEVLRHAYEYVTKEDILLALECRDLDPKQAKALLKSPTPLSDVYQKWESWETGYMDHIWEAMESRANEVLRAERVDTRNEGR